MIGGKYEQRDDAYEKKKKICKTEKLSLNSTESIKYVFPSCGPKLFVFTRISLVHAVINYCNFIYCGIALISVYYVGGA